MLVVWSVVLMVSAAHGLDNGLGLTPPMGWLTWERFRCITDCKMFPLDCISEDLVTRTADLMVSEGYLEAGYEYLGIDDCWLEWERDGSGRMAPDKQRFPHGMKYIADYLHERGLKFGMYQDYGNKTCAGYPGVYGHEQTDVDTFAEWDIDYLKLDGCYIDIDKMDDGYPSFGRLLNATGRPILYSCSWPAYQEGNKLPNYESIAEHCNLWRNWGDIDDSWTSVTSIINWFGDNQDRLAKHAGPGHWNDPDMLIVGNYGLSIGQAEAQMAIWAVLAAPLLISADLATMRPEFKDILLNRRVIAINQDPMGKQGLRIYKNKNSRLEVWRRELQDGSLALAFLSQRTDGAPYFFRLTVAELKLPLGPYEVEDLFEEGRHGKILIDNNTLLGVKVFPTSVNFYRFAKLIDHDDVETDEENQLKKNTLDGIQVTTGIPDSEVKDKKEDECEDKGNSKEPAKDDASDKTIETGDIEQDTAQKINTDKSVDENVLPESEPEASAVDAAKTGRSRAERFIRKMEEYQSLQV